ncbi:uncharacterized protein LOC129796506 [Lutzomyia longipalpis]|uniref:uncharacterized protein LOC129796506 n=1 Tax=Lutzomyia longipalpis TaxID=7200 RepID=UPI002483D277|nr:uncharacterized protein LOC129796506 [Lutzomyia longipalpis]
MNKIFIFIAFLGILSGEVLGQSNFASLQSRVTSIARNFESEIERIHQDVAGFTVRSINEVLGQAYDAEMVSPDEVMISACNLNVVNLLRGDMRTIDDAIIGLTVRTAELKTIIFRAVDGKSLLNAPEGIREEVNTAIDEAQNELQEEILSVIRQIATFKVDTYNLIKTHRKCIANAV